MERRQDLSIWAYAFGYFACYAPYSGLTKALTSGYLTPGQRAPTGIELLPLSVLASTLAMVATITWLGWWDRAGSKVVRGVKVPWPSGFTVLSGLCAAGIIATTTLAYTFKGVSIVFVMLLMRGGVLVIAPLVDLIAGRHVRWFSWVGLALSAASLLVAVTDGASLAITAACAADIALYIGSYFVRLRLMSRHAKSDHGAIVRYFVEEQLVSGPALFLLLGLGAAVGVGPLAQLRAGFTDFWSGNTLLIALLIGVLSQGTGVFGGLVLLDPRENTYCVPVNRASSVVAGLVATAGLSLWLALPGPAAAELVGAALIIAAIVVLSVPPLLERRRKAAQVTPSA